MAGFSLAALTVLDLTPSEAVEVAARCGYEHVGLRLLPATLGGLIVPPDGRSRPIRETIKRLDSTGVTVADLEVVAFRPETEMAAFIPFFEAGARLGAKHVLVAAYDPDLSRFSERFAQFCEAASNYGLTSDLEFMPWMCIPDLHAAKRIVEQISHPGAGILVDALHFDRSKSSIEDLENVPVQCLHYWQLCDGPAEHPTTTEQLIHAAREERMFPGDGKINLGALVRTMPADLTISIEVPTVQLAKSVDPDSRARRALAAAKTVIQNAGTAH